MSIRDRPKRVVILLPSVFADNSPAIKIAERSVSLKFSFIYFLVKFKQALRIENIYLLNT